MYKAYVKQWQNHLHWPSQGVKLKVEKKHIRPEFQGYVREYPHKICSYVVQCLIYRFWISHWFAQRPQIALRIRCVICFSGRWGACKKGHMQNMFFSLYPYKYKYRYNIWIYVCRYLSYRQQNCVNDGLWNKMSFVNASWSLDLETCSIVNMTSCYNNHSFGKTQGFQSRGCTPVWKQIVTSIWLFWGKLLQSHHKSARFMKWRFPKIRVE